MPVLLQIAIGIGFIVLCGGVVNWVNMYMEGKRNQMKYGVGVGSEERLRELERRLTDVQDVMIALSEKIDRMEANGRLPGGSHIIGSVVDE